MKIYIAGPMTGLPDLNFPAFHATAKALRSCGQEVVNPAELHRDPAASWNDCMRIDIRELVGCDGIYLMPNWTMSRGARLEFHIASQLNMHIFGSGTSTAMRVSTNEGFAIDEGWSPHLDMPPFDPADKFYQHCHWHAPLNPKTGGPA